MKKYFGIMVVVLAISMSAFTAKGHIKTVTAFAFTNDDNPPGTNGNTISQTDYELCSLDIAPQLCGEKWNVDNPAAPVRIEKRYKND